MQTQCFPSKAIICFSPLCIADAESPVFATKRKVCSIRISGIPLLGGVDGEVGWGKVGGVRGWREHCGWNKK